MDTGFRRGAPLVALAPPLVALAPPLVALAPSLVAPAKAGAWGIRCPLDSGFRRNDEGDRTRAGGRRGMMGKNRLQGRLV